MNDLKIKMQERFASIKSALIKGRVTKKLHTSYQVFWNIFLLVIVFGVLGGAFAGGVGAGYFASLVKDEKVLSHESLEQNLYDYTETSDLYFANDVYLGKLRTDLERNEVELEDVSPILIDAVIATEDEYFNEHDGVVPKAIARALFQEVTNSSTQTGGSTLTQQLIKNQILTNEVSFDRKAKEILLALRVERFFDKDEILEAYLNVSPMGRNSSGRNIAGVQTAAQGIFGVDAKDLTLPQAAFIAGLPQAPFGYTPFYNTKDEDGSTLKPKETLQPGLDRMQEVLSRMLRHGSITQAQYDEAASYDITTDFIPPSSSAVERYPYVTYELEERAIEILKYYLAEQDGYPREQIEDSQTLNDEYELLAKRDIRQKGYEIHSTIDKELYDAMEVVKNEFDSYGKNHDVTDINSETGEEVIVSKPVQVGSVLMDNKTGRIISFTGGRDHAQEATNHATNSYRSSGSTIKPLAVYAPAIEYGLIGAGSPIADVAFTYVPNNWTPNNFVTGMEYGLIPARLALAKSHNLSAARLYGRMIEEGRNPGEFLERIDPKGISEGEYQNRAFSLGGLTEGISVEENVSAYAALGNMGQYNEPYMIDKIVDNEGTVIFEHNTEPIEMYSPATSYVTLDMMRDTMAYGSGQTAPGQLNFTTDWASKSGTSQDSRDNWFIGTNPNITFGIWFGYDKPAVLPEGTSRNSISLWAQMMNRANELQPDLIDPENLFQQPEGVVNRSFCTFTGQAANQACSDAGLVTTDLFTTAFQPTGADDGLLESKYVTINDKRYVALDSTPDEFSSTGALLSPDFAEQMLFPYGGDPAKLFPDNNDFYSNLLVAENRMEDDGSNPGGVTARVAGDSITWTPSASSDVVGYRVYSGSTKVTIKQADESLSASLPAGTYEVVAVDVAGKESARSNEVRIGDAPPPDVEDEDSDSESTTPPPATSTPPPDNGGGNGNGNNGGGNGNGGGNSDGDGSTPPPEEEPPEESEPPEEEPPPEEDPPPEEEPPEETDPPDDGDDDGE